MVTHIRRSASCFCPVQAAPFGHITCRCAACARAHAALRAYDDVLPSDWLRSPGGRRHHSCHVWLERAMGHDDTCLLRLLLHGRAARFTCVALRFQNGR